MKVKKLKSMVAYIMVIALVSGSGYMFFKDLSAKDSYQAPKSATTTAPTRLQQTQKLIEDLTEQRKKDQSFIAESKKQFEDLSKRREAQARIDALMIVKTQLDVEISNLEASSK